MADQRDAKGGSALVWLLTPPDRLWPGSWREAGRRALAALVVSCAGYGALVALHLAASMLQMVLR